MKAEEVLRSKRTGHWNLFDGFLILLVILCALVFYFSVVHPIQFSNLIRREGVTRYAEVEIIIPDDLDWIEDVLKAGTKHTGIFHEVVWEILGYRDISLAAKNWTVARAKVLVTEETSGILRYGKYTLVKGSPIFLVGSNHFLEGRVFDVVLLDERYLL